TRTLAEYNAWIAAGTQFNLRILEPKIASKKRQRMAADYWMENIFGTIYDFKAIPFLGLKAALGKWCPVVGHWEFGFYCTEGISEAYTFGAGLPVWGKKLPTPLTSLKRRCQGTFRLIKQQEAA
ncbi:MAG: hypothetical protein PHU12_04230, partial [Candidatus Aenigmarchaeota archaeon]|nr:hypothetical protein [Candidatus Aenigmarchaeota archaeon]